MNDLSCAGRPLLWNISGSWIMYLLFAAALCVFAWGAWRRIRFWRNGKPDGERLSGWFQRLGVLLKEILLQKRVRGSRFPGWFHCLIFYSFLVLVATTVVVMLDCDFGTSLFGGYLYVVLTLATEIAGLLILVGVGMALYRRLVKRPETLPSAFADVWPLGLIGLLVLTGFVVEGVRIAAHGDEWAKISFVGYVFSLGFSGLSEQAGRSVHAVLWWMHAVLAMAWIASIPFTKFVHLLSLPTNIFFSKLKPRGELSRVDIMKLMESEDPDADFNVGVGGAEDFTWKQRLDFDACISCGRCDEVCPAVQAGHPFSPREFVAVCREALDRADDGQEVMGKCFDNQFVWYCRTCMACMEVCPACIDHVDTLIELRRNQALMHGHMPTDAARALKLLERQGNPFGPQGDRMEWVEDLGVRIVGPGEECDVIYWIGCCTTFDPTKRRIAEDLCALLKLCGISFGVLGTDERCCGDPARLLGDERLFQDVAKSQVEDLNRRKFRILLTSCPHCYNVLKNEYPQFGGHFNVVHHSEFLHEMLWSGELMPRLGIARRIVYHDPCYLGRYQKVYDSPRQVLKSLPGAQIVEMRSNKERSLCCGGGGGHFWMDLKTGRRINNLRVEQARQVHADTIATGCAYCQQMLTDAVKQLDLDDEIEVVDIATLIMSSLRALPDRSADSADESRDEPELLKRVGTQTEEK